MKFSQVATTLISTSTLAFAANDEVAPGVNECARGCIRDAVAKANVCDKPIDCVMDASCKYDDLICACQNGDRMAKEGKNCVIDACNLFKAQKVKDELTDICKTALKDLPMANAGSLAAGGFAAPLVRGVANMVL